MQVRFTVDDEHAARFNQILMRERQIVQGALAASVAEADVHRAIYLRGLASLTAPAAEDELPSLPAGAYLPRSMPAGLPDGTCIEFWTETVSELENGRTFLNLPAGYWAYLEVAPEDVGKFWVQTHHGPHIDLNTWTRLPGEDGPGEYAFGGGSSRVEIGVWLATLRG